MDLVLDFSKNIEAAQKTYSGKKRSDLKDSDFLFPQDRSFPIVSPQDIADAISNFFKKVSYGIALFILPKLLIASAIS